MSLLQTTKDHMYDMVNTLRSIGNGADANLVAKFIRDYEALEDSNNKRKVLLEKHGVCEECGEMMSHSITEPIASCKCKQAEWYHLTPYMELEQKVHNITSELVHSSSCRPYI